MFFFNTSGLELIYFSVVCQQENTDWKTSPLFSFC